MESAGLFAGLVPVTALVSAAVVGQTSLDGLRLVGAAAVVLGVCGGVRAATRSPDPIDELLEAREPGARAVRPTCAETTRAAARGRPRGA